LSTPHPTPFPYTTLFRSQVDDNEAPEQYSCVRVRYQPSEVRETLRQPFQLTVIESRHDVFGDCGVAARGGKEVDDDLACIRPCRSEEHTSELQSPDHLVC